MGPKQREHIGQEDLFRMRLENMIDRRHELVRLAKTIDWERFDREWGEFFQSKRGAPAIATRLIAGLHYLKHAYGLSDEAVVHRWVENPYWQFFCGEEYFQHRPPIHPTSMTRWRKRLGEAGCEMLLAETVEAGVKTQTVKRSSFNRVVVDATVQEKNIAYPTDSKLLNKAREQLVNQAQAEGLSLRQNYNRVCARLVLQISRYAHARQYKRMRRALKKLKVRVGRVVRDVERQLVGAPTSQMQRLANALAQARQLLEQHRTSRHKLYSLHAPEVECISKGKTHKRYEFGVKASFAVTHQGGLVVGARSYPGNPYDGHTLSDQLEQVEILTGVRPQRCYADLGYRGHGESQTKVYLARQKRGITETIRRELKRRNAIEPEIGHMKQDGLLGRCYLKGSLGDALNVILVAAGHNLRKILNRLRFFFAFWLALMMENDVSVAPSGA